MDIEIFNDNVTSEISNNSKFPLSYVYLGNSKMSCPEHVRRLLAFYDLTPAKYFTVKIGPTELYI